MKRFFLCLLIVILCVSTPVYADPLVTGSVPESGLTEIPEYEGFDYAVINDNLPDFFLTQLTTEPYVLFSELDALGRTGAGMACLGPETLPSEPRGAVGMIQPSGWHTVRYDDLIEDRYLYNRAHVIGYLLCGDNATPENLFTGTRHLNTAGMLQFESSVQNYIRSTGNHVIYRSSPKYAGDDLVASGVQIEAYSVEDEGFLCFNVFVFNIQPGITIDYATGDSRASETHQNPAERSVPGPSGTEQPETAAGQAVTYVLNKNTHKFHYPSCPSAKQIKDKNRRDFYGTRSEAIEQGYEPCKRCNP